MPRKLEVDQHPDKDKIVKALIRGELYRNISQRYGISKSAISRYLNKRLVERAAKVKDAQELRDGKHVLREIQQIKERCMKMYDACDAWLTDPDNPDKYYLGPRSEEVTVVVTEEQESRTYRAKRKLSDILAEIEGGGDKTVEKVQAKHADPRELLLRTASELNRQLELVSKIIGAIKEVQINILKDPSFNRVVQIVLNATQDNPEIRQKIASELEKVE